MHVVGVVLVDWLSRLRETSQNSAVRSKCDRIHSEVEWKNGDPPTGHCSDQTLEDAEYITDLAHALSDALSKFVIRTKSFPLHVPRAAILSEVREQQAALA